MKSNQTLYNKGSLAAYKNCLGLLKEAFLLEERGHYARSFALAVLSCEEFAKAFLYKCIASGFIVDKEYSRDLEKHELKLAHLIHIFTFAYKFNLVSLEWQAALLHDQDTKDHAQHVLPSVLDKFGKIDAEPIAGMLILAHEIKMQSLYVDIREGKLLEPNMSQEICHNFLFVVDRFAHGFDVLLKKPKTKFRMWVQMLDPDILKTGKIKFDFMPKGRFELRKRTNN